MAASAQSAGSHHRDPSASEQSIREICAEVLGRPLERVRESKSFLAQGGDSLLAISLMSRCRAAGYDISIHDILQSKTILELCQSAQPLKTGSSSDHLPGIKNVEQGGSEHRSSAPLNQLQQLYMSSGLCHARLLRLRNHLPGDFVGRCVQDIASLLPGRSNEEEHGVFVYATREVAFDTTDDEITTQENMNSMMLLGQGQEHAVSAMAFIRAGTSTTCYVGLVASRAKIDVTSFEILLTCLDTALSAMEFANGQDGLPSKDCLHNNWGRQFEGRLIGNDAVSQSDAQTVNQPQVCDPSIMQSVPEEVICRVTPQKCHIRIDIADSVKLFDRPIHRVLRTEAIDFVVAALRCAVQLNKSHQAGRWGIRTILDGRSAELSESPSTIGCFDQVVNWFLEDLAENAEDISLLRCIKDSRLGHFEGSKRTVGPEHWDAETGFCILLDATLLQPSRRLKRAGFDEVSQRQQHVTQHILTFLPNSSSVLVEPYWDRGHLQFCFSSLNDAEFMSRIASDFHSALKGLLSRFLDYETHATLSDFPLLEITYVELDNLFNHQLKQIASKPLEDVESIFPCSRTQENFLVSQRANRESYQCTVVTEIKSTNPDIPVDYVRLCSAWGRVVGRHPSLRTRFYESTSRSGHFDQVVMKHKTSPTKCFQYCDGDENTAKDLLFRRAIIFNDGAPTHQATLCKRAASSAIFRLDISHAVVDGQSISIIFHDLARAYIGETGPALMPYHQFVSYQDCLSQERSLAYWSKYLAGAQSSLFPTNNSNAEPRDFASIRFRFALDSETIGRFSDYYNATIANLCQVAWALVLGSYAGLDDVCFSYVNSGRSAPIEGIEHSVGAFVDTMICRVKLSGAGATVAKSLAAAKHDLIQGLSWPASLTMGHEIQGQKISNFRGNTIMTIQAGVKEEVLTESGLEFHVLDEFNLSDYDISLNIEPRQQGLEVQMDYWQSRIDQQMAERISQSFEKALSRIMKEDRSLSQIDVVPAQQIDQFRGWNESWMSTNMEGLVQDVVDRQNLAQPDALAVQGWDGDVSYRALSEQAGELASYLQSLQAGLEDRICVCFEKSKWAAVSQLAVLKSGAAVVPLSESQPKERVKVIIRDTGARIVLTAPALAVRFSGLVSHVITVNQELMSRLSMSQPSSCRATPSSLAYVIYTSGSTGTPKGVMLTHGGISHMVHRCIENFQMDSRTRVLQFAAYTFDAAIAELFLPWSCGGCACIISEHDRLNALGPAMRHYNVNFATLTPTVAETLSPDETPSLETLVLIGEAVKPSVVGRWMGHARLFNGYGPSECSIISSSSQLDPGCDVRNIGHALCGAFWVVDPTNYDRLLPIGAIGELLIEGPHLARGYLNDEVKTSSSFICNPAWASDYAFSVTKRFYRTGDLVQRNPDGSINFLGRRDTQIKLRGQRVEAAEIEHNLIAHKGVIDAAIILPVEGPCKGRLVAVLALRDLIPIESLPQNLCVLESEMLALAKSRISDLSDWLSERVPPYMVPTIWIPLASMLPQNDSGKLDRARLKRWVDAVDANLIESLASAEEDEDQELVATSLQIRIRAIWADVLRLPMSHVRICRRSFLSLGGDSISAMKVVSQARGEGIGLNVPDILQSKSIVHLAEKAHVDPTTAIDDANLHEQFPLSPIQQWYLGRIQSVGEESDEVDHLGNNQSICLDLHKPVDSQQIARAIDAIVSKHHMLRARFDFDTAHGWSQRIVRGPVDECKLYRDSAGSLDEAAASAEAAERSLNLRRGPVFRAHFIQVQVGDNLDKQLLFMTAHHLVVDRKSWCVIVRELDRLLSVGSLASMSETLTFRTWIWNQEKLSREKFKDSSQSGHSENSFVSSGADLDLWRDSDGEILAAGTAADIITLDEDCSSTILSGVDKSMHFEPAEILLAALIHSFSQTFPDRLVPTIYEKGHERDSLVDFKYDVTDTVGCFTTIVPVYVSATRTDTTIDILKRVKDSRRSISRHNSRYSISKHLAAAKWPSSSSQRCMEILFSYDESLNRIEEECTLFSARSLSGRGVTPGGTARRTSAFSADFTMLRDKLNARFEFDRNLRHGNRTQSWTEAFSVSLQGLLADLAAMPRLFTLSDFPLSYMTYDSLARLQQQILPGLGVRLEDVEDIYPCTPIQQGILMSQARSPWMYQTEMLWQIQSPDVSHELDVNRVMLAYQTLVNRHSMLRTVFVPPISSTEGGTFSQVVLKSSHATVCHETCRGDDLDSILSTMARTTTSDYGVGPNHKMKVYSLDSGSAFVHIVINHALCDGSSLALLEKELTGAYNEKLSSIDRAPSYSEYVSFLQKHPTERDLNYWKAKLADAEACFLPALTETGFTDDTFKRSTILRPTTRGLATSKFEDSASLRRLREKCNISTANVFQLAWALVLSKYVGSKKILFGYIASGRDVPVHGIHEMFGPLANVMVSRIELDVSLSVQEALQRLQSEFLDDFNHQRAPLVDIWHALNVGQRGLFNTHLSYRQNDSGGRNLIKDTVAIQGSSEYDVGLDVVASLDGRVTVSLDYSPDHISSDAATQLLDCLQQTVSSLTRSDTLMLGQVQVTTEQNIRQLRQWNHDIPRIDAELTMYEYVNSQCRRQPEAQAVCAWDGDFTYSELNQLGNRLADYLTADLGVKAESKVGLCLDKSRWVIVAQLAILKAGGVIVPISNKDPAHRVEKIVRDAETRVIITSARYSARFAQDVPFIVRLDEGLAFLPEPGRKARPEHNTQPQNAAFIIYTSGSTGIPKGVVLSHSSIMSGILAHGQIYGLGSHTRTLQFAAHTFDISIAEIWTTLCYGGCVCVLSEDERLNRVQDAINLYQVNFSLLTPTVASILDLSKLPSLKVLAFMGESLKPDAVEEHLKTRSISIYNSYGPSECSVLATCSKRLQDAKRASIIGRPLTGSVWLVDDSENLCPIGAMGEIWIEGPLLAHGYFKDPEKTAKSFVTEPGWARQAGLQGRRLYKTGDLARQNFAGEIIYIGRKDTQIKIRGQRVEVGEIEYTIKQQAPWLQNAVASLVLQKSQPQRPLVAVFLEPNAEMLHTEGHATNEIILRVSSRMERALIKLRSSLQNVLPSHMIPSLFVPVAQLPVTISAKVDRLSLRHSAEKFTKEEVFHYALEDVEKTGPTTETEKELQALWAATLQVDPDQVGTEDDFFHSGGDSYLAMRLVGLTQSPELKMSLSVSDVFQNPRLVDMARVAHKKSALGQTEQEALPFSLWKKTKEMRSEAGQDENMANHLQQVAAQCEISADKIEDVYPCTPLQEGLMVATAQQPRAYVARWVYRVTERLDVERFKMSWRRLVVMAPILRTRIIPGRFSGALQVVVREDVTWLSGLDLAQYLERDTARSMGYGSSLCRLAMVESGHNQRYFVWTAHHSVYDGWSLSKMLQTLSSIYRSEELPRFLPPYPRFIEHVMSQGPAAAAKSFWQAQLSGELVQRFPMLPSRSYQPQSDRTMSCRLQIGPKQHYMTLASLLRAAWALTVSGYSGGRALFAMPLSGRNAPVQGIMDIIAPTITTVPIQINVDEERDVKGYLSAVQQQAIDMLPFEHTGLQHIRRLVGHDIDLGHIFAVQSMQEREDGFHGSIPGLEAEISSARGGFDEYALTVQCITGVSGERVVDVVAQYDEKVLSESHMQRILDRFGHILAQLARAEGDDGVTAKRAPRVGDIELLSPHEIASLCKRNQEIPRRKRHLLHHLVARQAKQAPEKIAVSAWDGEYSHGQLDQLSDRLAQHLAGLGIGPESLVLHCFDKTKLAVVAMLAVLKAGGAMVPVKADPMARLQAIVLDTKATVMLTTWTCASQLQGMVEHVLCIDDTFLAELPPFRRIPASSRVEAHNAACVVYTSGSTGTPKGVVLEHVSLSTGVQAEAQRFGATQETRSLQFAAFTFDMCLHDIFVPLVVGGCVCLPSDKERMNDLAGAIRRLRVNYLMITPKVLNTLTPSDCPDVRTILVGGEAVHAQDLAPWQSQAQVMHVYGPAECSIVSTAADVDEGAELSLGSALSGSLWLTDATSYNKLCPIGSVGELLIEGPLLARGYLNNPKSTATAFIENPAWLTQYRLNPGGTKRRMYRTGDLVVQRDDGSLKYMGRRDNQIKVRGQRVETEEVEHHLKLQAAVQDAVVLYPRHGPSQSRLVGLLTLHEFLSHSVKSNSDIQTCSADQFPEAVAQVEAVGQELDKVVPEYMVPSVWITLAHMPRNNSDKADRPRLLDWVESLDADSLRLMTTGKRDDAPVGAVNEAEQRLQAALAEVLGLSLAKVALDRSFLSMGGDSITSMQVVSYCRAKFGMSVHVRDVLQSKSIRQLALGAKMTAGVRNRRRRSTNGTTAEFELSPIQQLYFRAFASDSMHCSNEDRFNQSVCLVPKQRLDTQEIAMAAKALVSIHPMLRAKFQQRGGGSLKQIIQAEDAILSPFSLHEAKSRTEIQDVMWSAQRCLDIEQGPIFSVHCIEMMDDKGGSGSQLLFLVAHHLVVDIVSWRIIIRDLGDLIRHGKLAVSEEATTFQNWLQLQAEHATEVGDPHHAMPIQVPDADWDYWGVTAKGNRYGDRIDERFTIKSCASALFDGNNPLRSEPVEVLIAALLHSFQQVFPDRGLPTVFNEGHGREPWMDSLDVSNTVGWFTTMVPIHVPVGPHDSVVDVLKKTKDLRRSIPGRGFSYFTSRFLSADGREAFGSHDWPEIMFNFGGRYHDDDEEHSSRGSLFRVTNEYDGAHLSSIGRNVRRIAVFEVEASVQNDDLVLTLGFSKHTRHRGLVAQWAREYQTSLSSILRQLSTLPLTLTRADFPLLDVSYDDLERLQTEVLPREAGIRDVGRVEDVYHCSPAQQSMLTSQAGDASLFQVRSICELRAGGSPSEIRVDRLQRCWQTIVSRHAILRTLCVPVPVSVPEPVPVPVTFGGRSFTFHQVVLKSIEPRMSVIWCETGKDALEALEQHQEPAYRRGEPQHHLTVCNTKDQRVFIRLCINHALVDISSLHMILQQLAHAHGGAQMPESPAPSFGSYMAFLQKQSSAAESSLYWRSRLRGAKPSLFKARPSARGGIGGGSGDGGRTMADLSADICDLQRLQAFRDEHGITFANILQLAWALVLARFTESDDALFGYVANGRDAPVAGVNDIVGPLINMTVSHVRLHDKSLTVAEAAEQVQNDFVGALPFQRTPLGEMRQATGLSEDQLLQTVMSVTREPDFGRDAGASNDDKPSIHGVSVYSPVPYAVSVNAICGRDTIRLSMGYSTGFMDRPFAERLFESFQRAIYLIASHGGVALRHVDLAVALDD